MITKKWGIYIPTWKRMPILRRAFIACASVVALAGAGATSQAADVGTRWVASWTSSIQAAYVAPTTPQAASIPAYEPQPDLSFALKNATVSGATDQTFRMIVKPDLWGASIRIRLSNAFGTQAVTFTAASVGLQDYQANLVRGTGTSITFHGGAASVTIPAGGTVLSDPVKLAFVDEFGAGALAGRNLAVSFAVSGSTGPASFHDDGFVTSYISAPNSGDVTRQVDDTAFPYSTTSVFFLSELDVLAPVDTLVVVAFGDSITDGTFSTVNGNDRWSNVMSRALHDRLGRHVSVVNEGIGGNAVTGTLGGQSAVARLNRDVLSVSGAGVVVWLEGINDLGGLATTPPPIIAGYKQIVKTLHSKGILVIGATVTSSLAPGGKPPANSPLAAAAGAAFADRYNSFQTDGYRKQLNNFILTSGIYDGTADYSAATIDPGTGTLQAPFVPNSEGSAGDYLHPNRAGYQAMGVVGAKAVLKLLPH
jgi:lysophospholipase L1-like esterase